MGYSFIMKKYNAGKIEGKWQKKWADGRLSDSRPKEKRYVLDMFPYPSGEGLHMGHVESYTATDIYSRFLEMKGYDVLHPQGWDAFGLPAENYAIKMGIHPAKTTKKAISVFKRQINSMGFSYDWGREINSSEPEYYKWTQWFFLLLYKKGLAYKKKAKVNWCEKCQTVLANEQAEGGKCERCESAVIQRDLDQWFFKITDFIEDQNYKGRKIKGLLGGLDDIDWPESTKRVQKNWIGKSEGVMVKFRLKSKKANIEKEIEIYTTRPDTLFGCSYFVLSPEHPLIGKFKKSVSNWDEFEKYRNKARKKTELEKTDLAKEKTGVKLKGVMALNPVNGEEIPVFAADYVLADYGTGAVMAVPAHDQRDWEFAKKYDLPIIEVLKGGVLKKEAYLEDGAHINSSFLDGLAQKEAAEKIVEWLEKKKMGGRAVNYKIRDWLVGRQRYWGAPIPIIYCEKCGEVPVPEKDLPVKLPGDVDFMPTGESPLKYSKKFQNVKCPKCGAAAKRESDTMDTFVCSSWYYLRYADPKNEKEFAGKKAIQKWLPVDVYIGGAEHVVLHLLYSRFFTKVLQKYGFVDFNEPFQKLRHQGMILAENGEKMSKSKGNVVNPDEVVKEYGADILRMYEMFMGPLEDAKPWNTKGIVGIKRFLERVWSLGHNLDGEKDSELERLLHKTIKKVTKDIEEFKFNTAISQLMIFANKAAEKEKTKREIFSKFLLLLSPFAPHIAEELWERMKAASVKTMASQGSIFLEKWPPYDAKVIQEKNIKLIIQINGKVRDIIEVEAGISVKEIEKMALSREKIQKWIGGAKPKKVIYIPGRLVNLVV